MAHRSQSSSLGDNPLDPNYLPPHYREEYRLAIDALVEDGLEGYYEFLQSAGVVDFLSRTEIEHIKSTVQAPHCSSQPELPYQEEPDGSSDTYWPVHSDLDAPGLDLGWPSHHSFIGPTEVTTLVNPSDPDMPSIKEQARRLIKNAQQVIAVVMDIFTDIDIFSDLLDATARHVPVYILLDEQNAHHFAAMVTSCKVNLDMIQFMRVRTVSGTTYFCRTGKSFKGQVMDRFLLADCRAVLSGNYSFMWSFEKIHRCIAHLFLGELVTTFDEEFRILFAQSHPLVIENALVPLGCRDGGSLSNSQFSFKRTQSLRNFRGSRRTELSGYSFGDRMDIDRNVLPLRRDDPFRHSLEPGLMHVSNSKYASQQLRMERSFLDQGRSLMASRQSHEMNVYKRHSYAEGTHESYSSSRQFMKHRVMNNLDEVDAQGSYFQREQHFYQGGGSGSAQGLYDKIKSQSYHQTDEFSDSGYPPELEPPGTYNRAVDYLSSTSSKDISHDLGVGQAPGGGGRYGQTNPKRPSVGQPYACQSSPTQLHPPEHKRLCGADDSNRQQQDPEVKQGLRNWRISSFLSAFEDAREEGLQQPLGPDAFDEPTQPQEGKFLGPEHSVPRFTTRDFPKIPTKPDLLPRYGKPLLPGVTKERLSADSGSVGTDPKMTLQTASGSSSATEGDKAEELEVKEPRDISITKHESFRSRVNPMLLRSSRLRSSLIFSSSKLEEHSSAAMKSGAGFSLYEEEESDRLKTSSIVAQILEKRRSLSREPFEWRSQKKMDFKDSPPVEVPELKEPDEVTSGHVAQTELSPEVPKHQSKDTAPEDPPKPTPSTNMNDPENRLTYFKELAAKRKASNTDIESTARSPEPTPKKPDLPLPLETTNLKPTVSITSAEPVPKEPEIQTAPPQLVPKTPLITVNPSEHELTGQGSQTQAQKQTKSVTEMQKKEVPPPKPLKPLPSPKVFKKEILKPFKSAHSRHVSCGEEILTDATDAEKSELKKSRSNSSSGMIRVETSEKLQKKHGSNTSLNISEGGGEGKALEFLKKQTQRLKGFLGTKGDKKAGGAATAEDKVTTQAMSTVPEVSEESAPRGRTGSQSSAKASVTDGISSIEVKGEKSSHKPTSKSSSNRYQSSTTNVLYSSNLRDDTKVILEQISANSQKNRMEIAKQSSGGAEEAKQGGDSDRKAVDKEIDPSIMYHSRNRFQRLTGTSQERDSLLKRIESMRKEKKVYSRFEVLYGGKEDTSKIFEEDRTVERLKPRQSLFKIKR